MPNIAIDTSIMVAVIAEEPSKPSIISSTEGKSLVAPHSLHWELGNAFSAMYKKRKITYRQSMDALDIYKSIPVRFVNIELRTALELSHALNLYAYDAYILATALHLKCPLITLDDALARSARQLKIELVEVRI